MPNILCSGPGPHTPASGILGTTDSAVPPVMLCSSTACQAAVVAAAQAAQTAQANTATLQAALDTRLGQLEAWLTANPNGAVLTGPQTLILAKMLVQLTRLLRNNVSSIGQGS